VAAAEVAGVDACKGGWVAVVLAGEPPAFVRAHLRQRFGELLADLGGAAVVAVDIPIGLLEDRWRAADTEARTRLGPARSSLFMTPPRPALQAATHAEATRVCAAITGKGCSVQAWGLRRRIFEVEALAAGPGGERLYEVHPELCFLAMHGDVHLGAAKKTWAGQDARRALLAADGIVLPADLGAAGRAAPDDVLDAAAAAWSAARIAAGLAEALPDKPEYDDNGRRIAIWR